MRARIVVPAVLGLALLGCGEGAPGPRAGTPGGEPDAAASALTVTARGDSLVLLTPVGPRPRLVAYVSREAQAIWIDRAYRDRIQDVFGAHISVSTGHWRIPLPGDSRMEPLTPGVPEREFEEFAIDTMPDGSPNGVGDFRVVLGDGSPATWTPGCRPQEGGGSVELVTGLAEASAATRDDAPVRTRDGTANPTPDGTPIPTLHRQDLTAIGVVSLHAGAGCTGAGDRRPAVAWIDVGR